MNSRFALLTRSRRRVLMSGFAAALVAMTALPAACEAGAPKNGGDIVFLIDSLGGTWIPNNSAISSFQGHIWGHVTDKLVYVDADGKVIKECRFMGLYTSSVYGESVRVIPYIRRKVAEIERRSGFQAKAHLGKELAQVVEVLPRDDLFQTPVDELFSTVMS
ncbi:MAG: NAD-glutamate dehydrogenase, partial [Bradyrhizobium sp.]|nr:NAD-glutamate dehydrogenase [Bradyrhizobium sp.]